jgi:Holliday junction resolvase
MGKSQREKGKRGERELASILRGYGYDAHRGAQYHGGNDSPDVTGLPGIHIEVKRTEALRIWDALAQAKADAGEKMPVVMHRRNDCEWIVIQPLKDWIEIYKEWEAK